MLNKYGYVLRDEEIASRIQSVVENLPEQCPSDILKKCFSMMDLTTLKPEDTVESVEALVKKANGVLDTFSGYPLPASVCVYPNFASVVKNTRVSPELHVTTVAGCFPSSQSFLEVKVQECVLAVRNGADEVVYPEKQLAKWTAIRYSADHILDYIELDSDHAMFEIPVPENWAGRSIGQIDIRKKYNINIIGIKKNGKLELSISPDVILASGETMLVLGRNKDLQKCFHI